MPILEFPLRFENPTYGLAGIILGVVFVVLLYFSFQKLRIAEKHLELVKWRIVRRLVRIMNVSMKMGLVISLSFLLATPYFPTTIEVLVEEATEEQMAQYTATVMLLMDVSYSMNYSDLKPTRLEVSKSMAKLLVNKMDPKDILGLITFAAGIVDTVPLTTNRTGIIEQIDNQTYHPSTAIGTALGTAIGALGTYEGGKAVVLFSDGKNNLGINVTSAADEAATRGIPVFTVFVGTYGLGEADPLTLREISSKTDGKFYEVRNDEIEGLSIAVSQISHEVKVGALKGVYEKLIIGAKDYGTPRVVFSALLVAALLLAWFTGV